MAMNGRQKAMTAALLSGRVMPPSMANTTQPIMPSDSIEMLRWIVEAAERGEIRLCDLRMETFQSPGYADFRTLNGRVEKMKLANNQFAQINFEIRPTDVGVRGDSNPDDDSGDVYGDELESPAFVKKPTTPPTPTGASAAREVIFDDDGSDPT